MTFVKGHTLATGRPKGKRSAKTEDWLAIVDWLKGDGGVGFKKKLENLSGGVEITKEEEKFMDYYMSLLEYHQPKLGRVEFNGKVDIKMEKIERLEGTIRAIAGIGDNRGGSSPDAGAGQKSV